MKKLLSIGLGLALIASAVIPFSDASRDAYHTYLYRQKLERQKKVPTSIYKVRPFSANKGTLRRTLISTEKDSRRRGTNTTRNLRYSLHDTRNAFSQGGSLAEEAYTNRPLRTMGERTLAWKANLRRRGPVSPKVIQNAVEDFETFENDTFSVEIPKTWNPTGENHFFTSKRSDFTISIKRVENKCLDGFAACAIALSKNENYRTASDKIITTSPITRQTHFSDTVLGNGVQTRTFTESFSGQVGDKESYIMRNFVADLEGGIYIIETQTSVRNAPQFIGVTKKIFDSFRIFPLEG
ncbi:hypothetical protein K9M41_04105 [Candidatus Gracilibacteria bacterium]|nr:hypothetical protein [Candidatus Gracilibacteria bacterium]